MDYTPAAGAQTRECTQFLRLSKPFLSQWSRLFAPESPGNPNPNSVFPYRQAT